MASLLDEASRNDSRTRATFIFYEFRSGKSILSCFQDFCTRMGADYVDYQEFEFWFQRFSIPFRILLIFSKFKSKIAVFVWREDPDRIAFFVFLLLFLFSICFVIIVITEFFNKMSRIFYLKFQRRTLVWDPGPRTQDPGPRTQDPGPRTQDPGPRTQDPGPRTQDPGPRTQDPGPRTQDPPGPRTLRIQGPSGSKDPPGPRTLRIQGPSGSKDPPDPRTLRIRGPSGSEDPPDPRTLRIQGPSGSKDPPDPRTLRIQGPSGFKDPRGSSPFSGAQRKGELILPLISLFLYSNLSEVNGLGSWVFRIYFFS
ncbi:hypothetical protein B9Z55_008973 [Caenorhabditis nigoni]|uniref:Mos1 transposase HTH domain-containing protein n=1 Tax=Caenorhabditis nigoni TaxID=1611254 RepID=A0A2G5UQ14_9PELO|nr:hypothetical protein B9Z55_008973 [Caenorhabditis nigoni]